MMSMHEHISIRPASVADSAAISRVCLLTICQGRSAETLVRNPELPSQVRALPYLHLPSGFGFVLVEATEPVGSEPESGSEPVSQQGHEEERAEPRNIVGYVVGTGETAQFEREADTSWWPVLRRKYPRNLIGTPLDRYFVGLIHKGPRLSSAGAAHIQVNVLGKYKKHGFDRLLVDVALQHLRKKRHRYFVGDILQL